MAAVPNPSGKPHLEGDHGSIWPLVTAAAATLLLLGVVQPLLAAGGALLFVVALLAWIREDSRHWPAHRARGERSDLWYASLFVIASETIVFGALFTYYFWVRGYATTWPPDGIPEFDLPLVTVNTVILVTSGFTAHAAHLALERDQTRKYRLLLLATVALGAIFLGVQAYEYVHAGFGPATNNYGTAFFALTGVHGFHVFAGLVVLAILLVFALRGRASSARASGVGGAVLYWHFVDAVWLLLFATLYLRWI